MEKGGSGRRGGREGGEGRREGGREGGDHSCHNTLQYWNWAGHCWQEDELSCMCPKNVKINIDNMQIS